MKPINAAEESEEVATTSIEQMIDFVHVAVVTVALLPTGVEAVATEEHGEGLCDPTAEVHVDGDVGAFLPGGEETPAAIVDGLAGAGVEPFATVEADGIVGVRLHEVDLTLEFKGVCPVVVAFAVGYIFATGAGVVEYDVHLASIASGVLVFGFVEGEDDVGVLSGVLSDDGVGAVGGGVVVYEYLDGEGGLLGKESLETVA